MNAFVLDILDASGARAIFVELSAAHCECFPDDVPESGAETVDEFFDRVTWLHDESSTTWFVLRRARAEKIKSDGDVRGGEIVGFACGVSYADSWYGAHLGVRPKYRRHGYGSYLMRVSQAHAAKLGITKLQASVDMDARVGRGRLLGYYESHGARVAQTGFGSAGAVEPSIVRIERHFTLDIARQELAHSEAVVFRPRRFNASKVRIPSIVFAFGVIILRRIRKR